MKNKKGQFAFYLLLLFNITMTCTACSFTQEDTPEEISKKPPSATHSGEAESEETAPSTESLSENTLSAKASALPLSIPSVFMPKEMKEERISGLESLIISTFEIPESDLSETNYYYNTVDLNGDGIDEYLVLIIGSYTSFSGSNTALIVSSDEGELTVKQTLPSANMPILVSERMSDGYRDILAFHKEDTASGFVLLNCKNGTYPNVSDGIPLQTLVGMQGEILIEEDSRKLLPLSS